LVDRPEPDGVEVFVTYEVMGQDIKTLVNAIDSDLTTAS